MTSTENKLTYDEIQGNIVAFLVGGSETTSITLSYYTYVLAINQDVQHKLREEINLHCDSADQSSIIDRIEKCLYLDMFIKEVTRMYPVSPAFLNRECVKDCIIGQHRIKKG